ncbi:zinc-ribbon domain-containing protein [Paracoccus yeei]|uniref:zinc-ribbon domain-containing protein n=1 Tax=Paracoccus yeei TaxID=147645 RepID=UPI0018E092D5|nr:zinc-ribbon domain-containing protein [Paracoccus yeei]
MRLTCPRCRAEYEIPDTAIPAAGREVECSSCAHVWLQMPAAAPVAVPKTRGNPPPAVQPAPAGQGAAYPSEPAPLSRPLDDSILSILREEAARELSARQAEGRKPAPAADHIPVISPAPPPSQTIAEPELHPVPHQPTTAPTPPRADFDWPVATVTLPDDAPPAFAPAPASTSEPEPQPKPEPQPEPAPAPRPRLVPLPEPAVSITDPDPESVAASDQPPRRLPDAALLAATLTRRAAPAPSTDDTARPEQARDRDARPDGPLARPARPAPTRPAPAATATALPAVVPARRGGYAAGFGLAVMLALAFLALYALAPRLPAGQDGGGGGGALGALRDGVDQLRLWLHGLLTAG